MASFAPGKNCASGIQKVLPGRGMACGKQLLCKQGLPTCGGRRLHVPSASTGSGLPPPAWPRRVQPPEVQVSSAPKVSVVD